MNTQLRAVEVLAYVSHCTDAAVEKLAAFAKASRTPSELSDLAAAYYVRAQRNDRPSDLVRSLQAADDALGLASSLFAARFNRALALEALGFPGDAIADWDSLRRSAETGWAIEAEAHRARLQREQTLSAATRWPENLKRLPLVARDRKAVATLVSPYRAAAHWYVQQDLLPRWAEAARSGNDTAAAEQLALAEVIASALAELTNDRYLLDAVERIRTSPRSPFLYDGPLAFGEARKIEVADRENATVLYEKAEKAFEATGNPLRLDAMLGRVTALTIARKAREAFDLLRKVEDLGRNYPHIRARVHAARAYVHLVEGHHFDAIEEYDQAEALYAAEQDTERLVGVHYRKAGLFRTVGHEDLTWREQFQAIRLSPALSDPQGQHSFLGEGAFSAVVLGYPKVALRYQNRAVELLRMPLPDDASELEVRNRRINLGIALRARASIRALMNDTRGARGDLEEAVGLMGQKEAEGEGAIVSGLRARIAEVEAETTGDRKTAIAFLSRAIDYAMPTHYYTLTASLLTRRAKLHSRDGERPAAVDDLERAISVLRTEEQTVLNGDVGPLKERTWSAYFSRYQEAYQQLIALLIEDKDARRAFAYSEKARAYEPLHRVLQRGDVPKTFLQAIRGGEPFELEEVKRSLPDGTFLLQYTVLDDRTFVWLIWNKDFEPQTLPVGNDQIAAWAASLQRLADTRAARGEWNDALSAPYKALLAGPIARMQELHRGTSLPKLVIVPDRAMHGLPFVALMDRDGQPLMRNHRVAVAASATLYAYSLEQDRYLSQRKPESVLIVADPKFDTALGLAQGLRPLQSARAEAKRIEFIYKPVADVPPPLVGEQATIPAFFNLAGRSTVIHIASHGVANPTVPSQSFLLLAPTENDRGVLDAERLIAELRLDRTRLVVLSACSTAGGTKVGPEGLAPLVRPLVAAGVTGIVGTLWQVDDSSAAELIVRFHQYYREGKDADEALRLAQLSMLDDEYLGFHTPRVWAPFQMIGHASSPFAP